MKTYEVKFRKHLITRQWRWKIKADNGKIIASSSEGFFNRIDCERNAELTGLAIQKHFDKI
jgi:uncharacterized protein YegP (UPF0339 family)